MKNITEIVQDLLSKKGYFNGVRFKKGEGWLKSHYDIDDETLSKVKDSIFNTLVQTTYEDMAEANPVLESKPRQVKGSPKVYWVTGCTHAPFHNKSMYKATIKYLRENVKLDGIILAGDILDLNSLSFHDKGKVPLAGVTLDWEYTQANKFMDKIQSLIREQDISELHFMYGNHEDRYNRILKYTDNNKFGKSLVSPEEALKLKQRGYTLYKDFQKDFIQLGDLHINHGEYINVHAAKKTLDVYKQSALFFHTHRFQIYAEGKYVGYNMGFGGNADSSIFNYAPKGMKMQWVNSSALVTVINGVAHVQPLMFINGNLVVNGKQF